MRARLSPAVRLASIASAAAMMVLGGCGNGSPSASSAADFGRGRQVATGTAPCEEGSRCFACTTCHGISGQGSSVARQPRLAGQVYRYLYRSLRDFASGQRESPTMQEIAASLSDQQMRDVAAYYAAIPPARTQTVAKIAAHSAPKDPLLAQGRALAMMGSAPDGIQACGTCHGPNGEGIAPLYPGLAGQYPAYVEQQLQAFKAGTRRSEDALLMRQIAERLSPAQMRAVAQYYGSLPPVRSERPGVPDK